MTSPKVICEVLCKLNFSEKMFSPYVDKKWVLPSENMDVVYNSVLKEKSVFCR